MPNTRKNVSRKHRGSGYLTDQQFFNPNVLPPQAPALSHAPSSFSTATEIRPVLLSTYRSPQAGGKNRKNTRRANASRKDRKDRNGALRLPSAPHRK